jgi:hypothetical protein
MPLKLEGTYSSTSIQMNSIARLQNLQRELPTRLQIPKTNPSVNGGERRTKRSWPEPGLRRGQIVRQDVTLGDPGAVALYSISLTERMSDDFCRLARRKYAQASGPLSE